jgi:hypothetical protein
LAHVDCKASYQIYDKQNMLVQVVDARRAQTLISRRLLVGKINSKDEISGFWLSPNVTVSQVKNVMRLKPARISICNRSTVVERGPLQFWHVSLLGMLNEKRPNLCPSSSAPGAEQPTMDAAR